MVTSKRVVSKKAPKNAEKEPTPEQIKKDFERFLKDTENKYNEQVTILLRAVDQAEKNGDLEKLKISKGISEAWIEYFDAVKGVIKKSSKDDPEGLKTATAFLDDQIKFFEILKREIERKLHEGKARSIRRELE